MRPPPLSSFGRRYSLAGFTLIELLVAISIVAVLAALALPAMKNAVAKSRAISCVSHLHQIGTAFYSYAGDHDGTLPIIDYFTAGGSLTKFDFWLTEVEPYLSMRSVNDPVARCPAIYAAENPKPGNAWGYLLNKAPAQTQAAGGNAAAIGCRVASIATPANTVMLFCSGLAWTSTTRPEIVSNGSGKGYGPLYSLFAQVHGGKANVLFVDGHVAPYAFSDINQVALWGK